MIPKQMNASRARLMRRGNVTADARAVNHRGAPGKNWYSVWIKPSGYPQPEDSYEKLTYGTEGYCLRCGIGGIQRHPFRLAGEWKARHLHFLQLNWVYDEIFVRPEVRRLLVARGITGIKFGPVTTNRTRTQLKSVQQLLVSRTLRPGLVTKGLQPVTCKAHNEEGSSDGPPGVMSAGAMRYSLDDPYCGRVKYHSPESLRIRRRAFAGAPDVVKTHEWFGSGGVASREILISERVTDLVAAAGWRGLRLTPVEIVD
jgi:hypothetical protein